MNKFMIIILVLAMSLGQLLAKKVTVSQLPNSTSEFVKLRNKIATTPEGGAVIWVMAMLKFSQDQEMGKKFMTIALARKNLQKGSIYKGYAPHRSFNYHLSRFKRSLYWPKAYIVGAKPQNGYAFSWPASLEITRNRYSGKESGGKVKVFVATYGVRPRPISLRKNNRGYWKADSVSSFFVGVQRPATNVDDDL